MPRLVELQKVNACRQPLSIHVGDVLLIHASGGRIQSGSSLELGGPYLPATAVEPGEVLTAVGVPHTMLAWARHAGPTILEMISGDPWQRTERAIVHVNVEE
jgi:hypothetical protein